MANEAELILEEAQRRFGQAEVFEEEGETRSAEYEDNRLKRASARQFRGVGLRVIHEGRIGFASTTDLRDPGRLVRMAAESAQFGEKAVFELPGQPAALGDTPLDDQAVRDLTHERMVEMGREALEKSLAARAEYQFGASVGTRTASVCILNTSGLDVGCAKTDMAGSVSLQEVSDSGLLWTYEHKEWGQPFDSLIDITEVALDKMRQAATIAPVRAETLPVIFTPKAVGNLLDPIMIALNGKLVHKGSSRLADRRGKKILDERITVTDDPTIPFAPASTPTDGEGLPARRTGLIERGVLKTYLLDLQTAGLLGMDPNANGHRSYASLPRPSSTNTVVEPGGDSYEDMVAGLERGLIVDQTLGAGQSNVLAGEFSVNVHLGFLVEEGKVRGRVKDCMVAGNVYDLLSNIEAIARERQWMGSDHLPAICVSSIKLAAQGGE
ncbi:MAG: TldD/PmbA family protein [Candidatus Brocadiia bacterium]|nr:TldD/PmbA family protein [Candidatus Brocadiia bacterium]